MDDDRGNEVAIQRMTEQDIVDIYMELLRREPESPDVIAFHKEHSTVQTLKDAIMSGQEYQTIHERARVTFGREKKNNVLIVSNCQATALAHSLSLMCPDVVAHPCSIQSFVKNIETWKPKLKQYDAVFMLEQISGMGVSDLEQFGRIIWIPSFEFRGFQPDITHVGFKGASIKGPMDDYHSIIIFAAFKSGLSVERTKQLFCDETYAALGYYDIWEIEKDRLIEYFKKFEFDLSEMLQHWIRQGCFMFTHNHPNIYIVYDMAKLFAKKLGVTVYETSIRPGDALAYGTQFPVYPDIAERLGIKGSLLFKSIGYVELMTLEEVIMNSFKAYHEYEKDSLDVLSAKPYYQAAMQLIAGVK